MRERLPNRRAAFVYEYRHNDQCYVAHVGRYGDHENGRIGEIFVTSQKTGTHIDTTVRATSTMASIAMQYGADLDTLRLALPRDEEGRPMEAVGEVMDLIAKEMAA